MGWKNKGGVHLNLFVATASILVIISVIASYRLFIGPSVYDRLVSLNVVGIMATMILVLASIEFDISMYLDIAMSFIMLDFVGSIAIIKYLEGGEFD